MSFSDECHIQQSEKQGGMDPVWLCSDLAMIISIARIRKLLKQAPQPSSGSNQSLEKGIDPRLSAQTSDGRY